jgi:hypothetical protein
MPTYEQSLTTDAIVRGRGIRHRFISSIPDGDDASAVRPTNWNDEHYVQPVPVTLVGSASSITNPLSITKPAGVQQGDLLLACGQFTNSVPNVAGPEGSGWTMALHFDTSSSEWQEIWYRLAGASEPSSWSWTHSAGTDSVGAVLVYRGITTLWNAGSRGDTIPSPPILTTTSGYQICVWMSTTGATPATDLVIPSRLTQDLFVRNTGSTNKPQILVGSRATPYEGAAATFIPAGGVAAYDVTWVGIFTP